MRDAPDEETREAIFQQTGIRFTVLYRLPYYDPLRMLIVDSMHVHFLGEAMNHCREVWGMDSTKEDYDGEELPPILPRDLVEKAQRALDKLPATADLLKLTKPSLHFLCFHRKLRRGGDKAELVAALAEHVSCIPPPIPLR